VGPAAAEVAALQQQGLTVAYLGDYHGQHGIVGRLRDPLPELRRPADLQALAARDPSARVLVESRGNPLVAPPQLPSAALAYRTGYWSIWEARQLVAHPGILEAIRARGLRPEVESTE